MIVCVCLNTALDRTITLDNLTVGAVNRAASVREDPGGKGVNAARTLKVLGAAAVCTGFVGGTAGHTVELLLTKEGVRCDFIQISGNTRTNIVLFENDRKVTTDINEAGPLVTEAELKAVIHKIDSLLEEKDVLVLSGSAPAGVPDTIYADLIRLAEKRGAYSILDATGGLLEKGLAAKPFAVKPNVYEAAALLGKGGTAADYAAKLQENGIRFAVVSDGAAGAAFGYEGRTKRIKAFDIVPQSTVGAGDAMVGAIAYGLDTGVEPEKICVLAMASSAAAVEMPGTAPGTKERIDALVSSYKE